MTVTGVLNGERKLEVPGGQVFRLTANSDEIRSRLDAVKPGERLRLSGAWKTEDAVEGLTVAEILNTLPSEPDEDEQR